MANRVPIDDMTDQEIARETLLLLRNLDDFIRGIVDMMSGNPMMRAMASKVGVPIGSSHR